MNNKEIIFETKDFRWKRIGFCNRCGWCCEQEKCPHLIFKDEKAICLIVDNLEQDCDICSAKLIALGKTKRYNHKVYKQQYR